MPARPTPIKEPPLEIAQMLAGVEQNMGFVPNSTLIMAKRPEFLKVALPMIGYIWGPSITIKQPLMAMVAYMCSYGSGCRYCQAHSIHVVEGKEKDAEKLENLWQFETSDLFDDRERAALSFAFASGQVPNMVDERDYERLAKYFSEDEILDLAIIVSVFGFLNRWNETLGVEIEDEPERSAREIFGIKAWEANRTR